MLDAVGPGGAARSKLAKGDRTRVRIEARVVDDFLGWTATVEDMTAAAKQAGLGTVVFEGFRKEPDISVNVQIFALGDDIDVRPPAAELVRPAGQGTAVFQDAGCQGISVHSWLRSSQSTG